MGLQGFGRPGAQQHFHAVHCDRVHPDDQQRKTPRAPLANVDHRVKCAENQAAPSGGVQCPRRSPDALHQRHAKPAENQSCREAADSRDDKDLQLSRRGSAGPQQLTGHQAEQHRRERGEGVDRVIAPNVEDKRLTARQQIQYPEEKVVLVEIVVMVLILMGIIHI